MLRSRLLYVIPALAAVLVAIVLLGPGQMRSVHAAKILATGDSLLSMRVEVVESFDGIETPAGTRQLSLFVGAEAAARWSGTTDADGVAEITLDSPLPAGSEVRLVSGEEALASGKLGSTVEPATVEVRTTPYTLDGGITLRVGAERGVLVTPFSDRVRIVLTRDAKPLETTIKVTTISADPSELTVSTNARGEGTLKIVPLGQPVILSMEILVDGKPREAEVMLPVQMSGMYVAPDLDGGRAVVISPGPRDKAYLSFHGPSGRTGGALVPLALDPQGFYRGLSDVEIPADTIAVVASAEADEKGRSTVVWPRPGTLGTASAPHVTVSLDGLKERIAREKRRASIVRTVTVAGVSAAAALELAILLWAGGRARRRLADFTRKMDDQPDEETGRTAAELEDELNAPDLVGHSKVADETGSKPGRRGGVEHWILIGAICALVAVSFGAVAMLVLR